MSPGRRGQKLSYRLPAQVHATRVHLFNMLDIILSAKHVEEPRALQRDLEPQLALACAHHVYSSFRVQCGGGWRHSFSPMPDFEMDLCFHAVPDVCFSAVQSFVCDAQRTAEFVETNLEAEAAIDRAAPKIKDRSPVIVPLFYAYCHVTPSPARISDWSQLACVAHGGRESAAHCSCPGPQPEGNR